MVSNALSVRGVDADIAVCAEDVGGLLAANLYPAALLDSDGDGGNLNPRTYGYCGPLLVLTSSLSASALHSRDEIIRMPAGLERLVGKLLAAISEGHAQARRGGA
jgi:hypothetical protein